MEHIKSYSEFVNESKLNENFPGPGETVNAKDLDYDMLDYFNRTNKMLSIDTKTKKGIKGSVGKMFGDLVFNGDSINKKDIVRVKILEDFTNEARAFGIKELRLKALKTLRELGVKIPSEEQIMAFVDNLKNVIRDEKLGVIMEKSSNKEDVAINEEVDNYMFFQNLKQIRGNIEKIMSMDEEEVDTILSDGHSWAIDHVSTSKDDIEEVTNFLIHNIENPTV
jgi:hypothetical protein